MLSTDVALQPAALRPVETVIENRIFVGGIAPQASELELKEFFVKKFDKFTIKDVKVISDRSGTSKGYGFVTFDTKEQAQAIIGNPEYENMMFKDRKLNISRAVKKNARTEFSSPVAPTANLIPSGTSPGYVLYSTSGQESLGYYLMPSPYYNPGQVPFYLPAAQNQFSYTVPSIAGQATPVSVPSSTGNQAATTTGTTIIAANTPQTPQPLPWSPIPNHFPSYITSPTGSQQQIVSTAGISSNEILYSGYFPQGFGYSGATSTSDYSSCSEPNSMDAGNESDGSPTVGRTQPEGFSPSMMTYSPAPMLPYGHGQAPVKVHQTMQQYIGTPQRMMISNGNARVIDGRADTNA